MYNLTGSNIHISPIIKQGDQDHLKSHFAPGNSHNNINIPSVDNLPQTRSISK